MILNSHPWFNMIKPEMSTGYLVGINEFPINTEIFKIMEQYNFNKDVLLQALKDNKHNHATTSYYLLLKKFEEQKPNKGIFIKALVIELSIDIQFTTVKPVKKRELNNSVQYSVRVEDLKPAVNSVQNRTNVFSVSDRDTSNTTDNNSKYLHTAVNFNHIEKKDNKRKVLESFNLVTINRK